MKSSDFKVLFDDDFKIKLNELVLYIVYKFYNPDAGLKLKNKIIKATKSLSLFPERHPIMKIQKNGDKTRKFVVDKYIIAYHIDYNNKIVYINNLLTNE